MNCNGKINELLIQRNVAKSVRITKDRRAHASEVVNYVLFLIIWRPWDWFLMWSGAITWGCYDDQSATVRLRYNSTPNISTTNLSTQVFLDYCTFRQANNPAGYFSSTTSSVWTTYLSHVTKCPPSVSWLWQFILSKLRRNVTCHKVELLHRRTLEGWNIVTPYIGDPDKENVLSTIWEQNYS
jgi:hypothetical protein